MSLKLIKLSPKQKTAMSWWSVKSYSKYDAIICDGAIRSGKTLCMSVGFVSWAMTSFDGGSFAICGKTITSLRRNVVVPLISLLGELGFACVEKISRNFIDISLCGRTNRFYLFGGKDESSASLIQGITLCGVLLDEVALMPRSFTEQTLARCSVPDSKLWFNCNPEHPQHWFYKEWILKCREKNTLYLHFTMEDNPSLTDEIRERYKRMYSGVFYSRFIEGKWTVSSGLVYPMFSEENIFSAENAPNCTQYVISCDYGTVNPCSMGLWGERDGVWYRVSEYYYSSRREGSQRTDEEHYRALERLAGSKKIRSVIVDPSAASFMECIRRHEVYSVIPAKNDVISGIRRVGDALRGKRLMISDSCADTLGEFSLYSWDEAAGKDTPIKENDHAMDDIRYFVSTTMLDSAQEFFVASVARK